MSFSLPSPPAIQMPKAPSTAQAPLPIQGSKPQAKPSQPTVLSQAAMAANPANSGQKTLLGT